MEFLLAAGQEHEVTQAPGWLNGQRSEYVIADKSHDAAALLELIEAQGAISVIPARRHRTVPRGHDRDLLKERTRRSVS